ncbi:MAG: hypothetical protein Q9191_002524 [Dirinaria sp. TL-2023a]
MDDDNRISITICGDGGCEDSYSVTRTVDGKSYYLSLTDTAGQEEYRGLWAASNLRSDAFLLVYDITAATSLSTLEYFLQMIDMECDHRHDSGGVQPVKIVAGNKCDLKDARVISSRQGLEFARSRDCGFMETSAREMVNIEETFARSSLPAVYTHLAATMLRLAPRPYSATLTLRRGRSHFRPLERKPVAAMQPVEPGIELDRKVFGHA